MKTIKNDLSVVLSGEAGQGIQSIEAILTSLVKKAGYNLFATKEYMSRVRGGVNSTQIRISSERLSGFTERIDILIPLTNESIDHLKNRISDRTIVLGDRRKINFNGMIDVDFAGMAREIGGEIFSNTIAAGVIAGILGIGTEVCENYVRSFFAKKTSDVTEKNIEAIRKGHSAGTRLSSEIRIELVKNPQISDDMVLTGSDAIALGAIAGGCDYVCGYPMSPSTGVLEAMAGYSRKLDIIVEQVEDEVGVVNMALGAWYAGARALVTTSGGGFALMTEGLSLCGMIESPLVVHLAQRPGPATGLPTRTMQGDLNLALYAGHGEFPRIILAPGSLSQGFHLMRKAFLLSDSLQVPVILMSDQFFVDSYYNTPLFDISGFTIDKKTVQTSKDYKRFLLTENGLSQRGIPGNGEGNVNVDSDEHDEGGHITEDPVMRRLMVEKRMRKNDLVKKEISKPDLYGSSDADNVVLCWGSTLNTVLEAVKSMDNDNVSILHYSWIFPLHETTGSLLNKKNIIAVENNEAAQFAQLVKRETGIEINKSVLKYDGLPFSAEEIAGGLKRFI
jgi:2-oxoglutarate/2-oxoacid ferredoxin oxidoreductase subunit alpha